MIRREVLPPYLYRVVFAIRLSRIATGGERLSTGGCPTFSGYGGNTKGRIFFTSAEGVSYWFGKFEDQVEARYDGPDQVVHAPVVLRVVTARLNARKLKPDEVANRESIYSEAWIYTAPVIPEDLEAWDGERWKNVRAWQSEDLDRLVTVTTVREDGEEWLEVAFHEPPEAALEGRRPEPKPETRPEGPAHGDVIVRPHVFKDGSVGWAAFRLLAIGSRAQNPEEVFLSAGNREKDVLETAERVAKSLGSRVFIAKE